MPPGAYSLANFLFRVFDAKRLIGRKFSDPEVQADMKHFPFKIIDKAGKPYIQVQYRGETKEFVRNLSAIYFRLALLTRTSYVDS